MAKKARDPMPGGAPSKSGELKDKELKEQVKAGKGAAASATGKGTAASAAKKAAASKKRRAMLWTHLPAVLAVAGAIGASVFLSASSSAPQAPPDPEKPAPKPKKPAAVDGHTECAAWAAAGECKANPEFMLKECKASCSPSKSVPPTGGPPTDTWKTPSECMAWAGSGECEKNTVFMESNCALSCQKVVDAREEYARRCPTPADRMPALANGAMNATFERIMSGHFAELQPEMINEDPPVVLFHNFLLPGEAEVFIKHGKGKYAESRGVGVDEKTGKMTDVKTEIRTSSHTWCQDQACLSDATVQGVVARVADVTQTPEANGEFAQLVYYRACPEEGHPDCAFYRRHSDYIEGDQHRQQGPRIYTLFMYLNDVTDGGGTRFTDLPQGNVTFQPSTGKAALLAILWPSVLWNATHTIDPRTHHEALPVLKGEKFGANFWIHQYDFKTPHHTGCTLG